MPCEHAKEFLRTRGVDFDDVNVAELDDAFERIRELTGGPFGTPTVVIGDDARVGFDPDWMEARLAEGDRAQG